MTSLHLIVLFNMVSLNTVLPYALSTIIREIMLHMYARTCTLVTIWLYTFHAGMRRRNVGLKLCLKALIDGDESCNKTVSGSQKVYILLKGLDCTHYACRAEWLELSPCILGT